MQMKPPVLPLNYVKPVDKAELVTALELIRHATAPSHDDGAHHENAHGIADAILKRVEAWERYAEEARQALSEPGEHPSGEMYAPRW
jgi:hypothetical protein